MNPAHPMHHAHPNRFPQHSEPRSRFARRTLPAASLAAAVFCCALIAGGCASSKPEGPAEDAAPRRQVIPQIYNLGPQVNSPSDDYCADMHVSRLMFTSKRPTVEGYIQGDDLWFSDRERGGWSHPLNFGGAVNSERDEGSSQMISDGSTVFFVQCFTPDGLGDADIYQSDFDRFSKSMDRKNQWKNTRNLGEGVNTKYWDSQPFLTPDGDELYFASDRPGGQGGTDIWVSKRSRGGKWGAPKNLGPMINTSGNEKAPTISPNGTLFFASDSQPGAQGYDLYMSEDLGRKGWSRPKKLVPPFNSPGDDLFFRLSAEEDTVYITSNRKGGQGGLDIWLVTPNPYKDTTRYQYYYAGQVYDTLSTNGIKSAALSYSRNGGDPVTIVCDRTGRFRIQTKPGDLFIVTTTAEGYESRTVQVMVPATLYGTEFRKSIALMPVPTAAKEEEGKAAERQEKPTIVLFDYDSDGLRAQTQAALDAIFASDIAPALAAKADVEIQLDAHTDDHGTEDYNIRLSRMRASAVSSYLVKKGAPLSSISINAYGESRPVDSNTTEAGRQLNRRVEIRITTGLEK